MHVLLEQQSKVTAELVVRSWVLIMLAIRLCLLHWQIDMLVQTYNHPMLHEQG